MTRQKKPKKLRKSCQNERVCISTVSVRGFNLKNVLDQTHKICLAACRQNGLAIQFVEEQTPEICMAACIQNGLALHLVKNQTSKICIAACQQNGLALKFVKHQTRKICLAACEQNGLAIQYVEYQTNDICIAACRQSGTAFSYVKQQEYDVCLAACKRDGTNLINIENMSPYFRRDRDYYRTTYHRNSWTLEQVQKLCEVAFENNRMYFSQIDPSYHTETMCLNSIKLSTLDIKYMTSIQSTEICGISLFDYWRYSIKYCIPKYIDLRLYRRIYRKKGYRITHNELNAPMQNRLFSFIISDICIAFRSWQLPPYVMLNIIDWLPYQNTIPHIKKIKHITNILFSNKDAHL